MTLSLENVRKRLVDEFDLSALSEDKQNELLDDMVETVMKKIVLSIGEKLGESDAEEFDRLLEQNASPEELEILIKKHVPDPDAFLVGVIEEFKKQMKEGL